MDNGEPEDMNHCVEILTNGYVQAYVDFFYLLHKEKQPQQETEASVETEITEGKFEENDDGKSLLKKERLDFIQEQLIGAESARRLGNPSDVFEQYQSLGEWFCSENDPKVGTYFYEKCLKIAQLINNTEAEKQANYQIGVGLQKVEGGLQRAITFLERYLELAVESNDSTAVKQGRKELYIVYERRAAELEASSGTCHADQIVSFLEKCVRVASEDMDASRKAAANFKLGRAFNMMGKPERAIVALGSNYEFCQNESDVEGKGKACAHLAASYLQIPNKEAKAIEYLNQCLEIARELDNKTMQAFACRNLGSVYTTMKNFQQAVVSFELNFELTMKNDCTDKELSDARILLGVALKNARREELRRMIKGDVPGLLAWKTNREFASVR